MECNSGAPTLTSTEPNDGMSAEEQKCREFIERTCGCKLHNGYPCSSLVPLEKYLYHRSEAAALTRDQLDLVL